MIKVFYFYENIYWFFFGNYITKCCKKAILKAFTYDIIILLIK